VKAILQNITGNAKYEKALRWGKLVTITGSAQVLIQGIGFITAIIIIRILPTREYALYTLANTILGTMILLADGGVSTGVMAQGSQVWNDPVKLGSVISTGLYLRKRFAIGSLLISAPVLMYLLIHHDASVLTASLITLALIPAFLLALSGTLYEVVPKIKQDIAPLQKIQVISNGLRLASIGAIILVLPWAFVVIFVSGLSQIWANIKLRASTLKYADINQPADATHRKEILAFVRRILPGSIYYCASGQITVWLISVFGSTSAVAQVGALGRLVMVLSLFNVVFSTLVAPGFARLANNRKLLLSRYLQIQVILFLLMGLIISVVWMFPSQILWVLGSGYANLKSEVVLNVAGSCLGLIAGCSFSLYTHRGWAIKPIILIPLSIAAIAVSAALIDISTLRGILLMNISVAGFEVVMHMLYSLIMISKVKEQV